MRIETRHRGLVLVIAALALLAVGAPAHAGQPLVPGIVVTETNTVPNYVQVYHRNADGTLVAAGQVATGGNGKPTNNAPLGLPYIQTNYEVVFGESGGGNRCLFVVNAGSNTVSSFFVRSSGLTLVDQEPSGGSRPVSLTTAQQGPNRRSLYVLNSDLNAPDVFTATSGTASIQGYYVSEKCALTLIPGSHQLTTSQISVPTTIAFNGPGDALAVAEPNTAGGALPGGDIDVFPVNDQGVAGAPVVTVAAPNAPNPYGMAWVGRRTLTVTNWNFVNPFGGTVTSYHLGKDFKLVPINTVPAAGHPCWNVITGDGKLLFTTEPAGLVIGTPQILAYTIGGDGTLTPTGPGATTPYNAVDEALSHESKNLYVLNDGLLPFIAQSAISEFSVDQMTGQLTLIGEVDLPGNATSGLAAW